MALQLLVVLVLILFSGAKSSQVCRCLPSQDCWPDSKTWELFNTSIDGALVRVQPVASVCHEPDYDKDACKEVTDSFTDPFWRAAQPGALQSANMEMNGEQGCLLGDDKNASCLMGSLPVLAVSATAASHVQKAVVFAAKHNLRLVIKNTGHDLTGRNTAAGALSIWTYNLKSIRFMDNFLPTKRVPESDPSAVRVEAGVQWEQLYRAADDHGKLVIGAQCTSVGASGGYVQGGGHSQLSPSFGLAADNILELEVVTADGELMIANACENADLFWALRGGGGGTFGVVIATTHAAHPPLDNLVFANYILYANSSAAFNNLLTHFISINPSLSASGWGGFFILGTQTLIVQYLLPNRDVDFAEKSFQPLLSYLEDQKQAINVVNGEMKNFSSYYEWHRTVQCQGDKCGYPSGFMIFEASRLIPRRVVEKSAGELAETLLSIQDLGFQRVSGYLVAGGKVSAWQNNAVNPAWRKALFHVLFVRQFSANETAESRRIMSTAVTKTSTMLRDMSPGSGTYMNEADPNEPDWKESFFGSNYVALKAIKDRVDPNGLFVCRHCVGSEDWSEDLNCRVNQFGL